MLKTPCLGPAMAAMLVVGASACLAAPASGGEAASRGQGGASAESLGAWDTHRLEAPGITAVGADGLGASNSWYDGATGSDHDVADARPAGEFGGAEKLANLGPEAQTDVLPLWQAEHAKAGPARGPAGVWDIFNRMRYGHLPEPASWALMVIGFGMIGAALRGFVVANRRLARLQPEDGE